MDRVSKAEIDYAANGLCEKGRSIAQRLALDLRDAKTEIAQLKRKLTKAGRP